jgi:hypothetical protein
LRGPITIAALGFLVLTADITLQPFLAERLELYLSWFRRHIPEAFPNSERGFHQTDRLQALLGPLQLTASSATIEG